MASGSFSTKWKGYTYKVEWSSTADVTNNQSTVTTVHKLICDSGWGLNIGNRSNKCTIDGTVKNFTSSTISTSGNSTHTLGTTTHTVSHGTDGTKTASFSADFYFNATISGTYKEYISISGKTITLDDIPREPTASCSVANSTIRENTATINWSSDSTIKEVDYSINGGNYVKYNSYSGGSTSGTLTGLIFNVNASNTIKVKLIRADNDLYKESNTVTFTTSDWPKATAMTNFTIGTGPTIYLYNPHSRSITLNIKQTSTNTLLGSYSGSGSGNITGSTSGSNFNATASINSQYNSIPSSTNGTYYCEVIYSGYSTKTFSGDSNTNKYSIKFSADEKPTLAASAVTAQNTSITSIAGTGYFLQDHNGLQIKITSQMTTNKGASRTGSSNTSARYVVSGSGLTTWTKLAKDLNTSTFYSITGKITGSSFTITVYDDRNQSSSVSIPVNYVPYTVPRASTPSLKRENGIGTKVLASISGTYKDWSGMATTNTIQSVKFKIPGLVSNYIAWPNSITSSSGNWSSSEVLLNYNFVITQSYDLYLQVTDKIGTQEYGPYTIGTADALLWRDLANKRLGIRTKPDYTLDVNGTIRGNKYLTNHEKAPWYTYCKTIDLTSLNTSTYYPVTANETIPVGGMHRVMTAVQLNSGTKPSWSTHNNGFSLVIDVISLAKGWGTTDGQTVILKSGYWFSNVKPGWYTQLGNSSRPCFYLLGGGKYFLYTDWVTDWTINTSSTTYSSQTVAPTTTVGSDEGISLGGPTKTSQLTNDSGFLVKSNLLSYVYPVGSIYLSTSNTSPASFLGGTWSQINGYYAYFGNTYSTTSYTGTGTQGHTLTAAQSGLPSHTHTMQTAGAHKHTLAGVSTRVGGNWNGVVASASASDRNWSTVNETGGHTHTIDSVSAANATSAHSHNIATVQIYAWRRTA